MEKCLCNIFDGKIFDNLPVPDRYFLCYTKKRNRGVRERIIMEKNLTSGSVFKNIVFFSLPYLLSYFLQTLYGMADLFIVGQFNGVDSITAVSVGSQVMHMLTVMIVGLAMGSTVIIGRAIGAEKRNRPQRQSEIP